MYIVLNVQCIKIIRFIFCYIQNNQGLGECSGTESFSGLETKISEHSPSGQVTFKLHSPRSVFVTSRVNSRKLIPECAQNERMMHFLTDPQR